MSELIRAAASLAPAAVFAVLPCALCFLYAVVLFADLRTARCFLERLLGHRQRSDFFFRTALGESLRPKLEAVQYRLHSLAWEAEHSERETSAIVAQISTPEFLSYQGGSNELTEFFAQVLPKICAHFRCAAAAFRTESGGAAGQAYVLSEGVGGKRFTQQLGRFVAEAAAGTAREGLVDGSCAAGFTNDLCAFGFRYSWYRLFEIAGHGRAALWLGYTAGQSPLDIELKRLSVLGPQFEQALCSFLKFQELGGKMAQAQSLTQEKTEVIAHLSHDIRSPLNNLSAILRLLKVEQSQGDYAELIDAALSNCSSASEMVDDLLDYSRHRLGRLEAAVEAFRLDDLAAEVAEAFSGAVKSKGLALSVDRGAGSSHWIDADRRQVRRIISNLIGNAVKYTIKGKISVEVKSADGMTEVIVRDTGVGMSEEQLAQLFTPFTRFHAGTAEGIGLGLALSKALAELNKGRIHARAEHGRGSEFILRFRSAQVRCSSGCAASGPQALDRARILLVDDDVNCLDSLARTLETFGCEVTKVRTTREAEERMVSGDWRAVISDGRMPCGGALKLLQHRARIGSNVPFVVLSGDPHDSLRLRALGAARVFIKPVEIEALMEFITSAGSRPAAAVA